MTDILIRKHNEAYINVEASCEILNELSQYFSFKTENAQFMKKHRKGWDGITRLFNRRNNTIYAGLLFRICNWAEKCGYTYEFVNNEFYGMPFEEDEMITEYGCKFYMKKLASHITPRSYQLSSVYEALRYNRKTIISATASGKSFIIYTIVRYHAQYDRKILIVVPRVDLVNQLTNQFVGYGWDEKHIHKVSGGFEKDTDRLVTISTWQSITEQNASWYDQFDCIMCDETHQAKSKELKKVFSSCREAKYRYGFTATLSNGSKLDAIVIEGLFGPVYRAVNTADMIAGGNASQLAIQVQVMRHSKPVSITQYEDEVKYLCNCEPRNNYLINLVKNLPGNTIVLFDRIDEHAIPFFHRLNNETTTPCHLIHGKIANRDKIYEIIRKSHNNILIASYGCCSTGIDVPNVDNMVFASSGKSSIKVMQSIGRSLRLAEGKEIATVYDIADHINGGSNYTFQHLHKRLELYNNEDLPYEIEDIDL